MSFTIIMEETSDNDYKELLEICQLTVAVPENQPHTVYCCKRNQKFYIITGYAFNLRVMHLTTCKLTLN